MPRGNCHLHCEKLLEFEPRLLPEGAIIKQHDSTAPVPQVNARRIPAGSCLARSVSETAGGESMMQRRQFSSFRRHQTPAACRHRQKFAARNAATPVWIGNDSMPQPWNPAGNGPAVRVQRHERSTRLEWRARRVGVAFGSQAGSAFRNRADIGPGQRNRLHWQLRLRLVRCCSRPPALPAGGRS